MNISMSLRPELLSGPKLTKAVYADRIRRFRDALKPDSVAIFVANPEQTRSNDTHFPYRQNSDIVYLNGFPEAESVLVVTNLASTPSPQMFVLPKDRAREVWTGVREGIEGAKANYLARQAYPTSDFDSVIAKLLAKAEHVYYRTGHNEHFDARFRKVWEPTRKPLLDPSEILHEMRLVKSAAEVEIMRHAGKISAEAHKLAMRAVQPGVTENYLQAVLEFAFRAYGCTGPAYGSIVAAGNNAVILHYTENDDVVKDGDLVLIDAAGEYGAKTGGYAADITRTFPANGKFTDAQRQIYSLVLEAQEAAIAAARPGARMINVHQAASAVLRRGLVKLGILPSSATAHAARKKRSGDAPKLLDLRDFYMHGTSHWLGLDVHDVGKYDDKEPGNRRGLRRRVLEPGMVITVEPGLYFDANDTRVPAAYRGIGIRIEDDILITADGNENLTADVPKDVNSIEALTEKRLPDSCH